jgi:hypothetical protein
MLQSEKGRLIPAFFYRGLGGHEHTGNGCTPLRQYRSSLPILAARIGVLAMKDQRILAS